MNIGSKSGYPSSALSNFAPHRFWLDGICCESMEGLLQAFKFSNVEMQKEVCTLIGITAKMRGKHKNWYERQILHWAGREYKRDSQEYQDLLDRAYLALATNDGFRRALIASGDAVFTHSMGKRKKNETVLTIQEFCSRLTWLRELINKKEI